MKYRTSSPNHSNVRTLIVSLLAYVLLTSQMAPLATAANAKANRAVDRQAPVSIADKSSGAAQPISSETQFAPVPKPLSPSAAGMAPLAVNIVATKTDNRTVAQPAAPGDTINYTVVIQNLGSTDATNVTFTDTIDANTTLVPGSIVSTPLANNDTYNVIGNVRIQHNAAQGLLSNDFNPDTGDATGITASGPATSTNGGNVTVNADGSFSYNPPVGFAGTDTFTYTLTVTATSKTDTGTVTLLVGNGTATPGTNVVWFINPAAAAGGDGRLTAPFNCYTGAGCFSTVAADEVGDTIFLYTGAHTGGNTLLNNQKLIGQGASDTLASIAGLTVPTGSDALPATGGASPTITTVIAATVGVPLGQGNTLRGFTVGNVTGTKISGTTFGTLTVGNNTTPDVILNGSGRALGLTTGTFAATSGFASVATTSSTAQGIQLTGVAGTVSFGSTTVSGATSQGMLVSTSTADINFGNTTVNGGTDAISLQNNSSGTRTFGTVTTSGNSGIGFLHSVGGGSTTVTGTTSITNPTGTGISIQNSTTAVSFAATTVNKGASAGTGVDLGNNSGNTTFNSLSITTSNGTGLLGVGNTGQINVTTNAGGITSTNGPAINITKASAPATPIALNFGTVSSTNSGTTGIALDRVSGNLTNTTTTTTNPTGVGILVQNTSAGGTMNFGNATSNTSGAAGVSLASNAGAVTFAALNIAPDTGITAFSASTNTGTITSSSGTIVTTDAPAILVTSSALSMVLTSVSADNTGDPDSCVSLTTASGTLNMQGGTLTGGTGAAFFVSGGNPTVTYSGSITQNSAARVVDIQGTTGNTVTFNTGTITGGASSTGINIANANGNVAFANGMTLGTSGARMTNQAVTITNGTGTYSLGAVSIFTTGAAQGIVASNADGTINCASGTVNSSGAAAINIDGPAGLTTLGMTLITVAASGGTNGILIQDTNGTFTVNGTGTTDGTGGTIQNTTGRGASFIAAAGITLKNMNFTNAGTTDLDADNSGLSTGDNLATNAAIHLVTVTTATLDNVDITGGAEQGINGNAVSTFNLANSSITNAGNAADEDNIHFFNMTGTSAITNTALTHTSGGGDDNLNLQTQSGILNLTISGGSATGAAGGVNQLGSGYLFGIRGTSNATITFTNASSINNFSGGIVADAFDTATMDLIVTNSTSSGNNDQLSVSAGDNSNVDLTVTGNTLSSVAAGDFVALSLLGSAFDNGFVFDASISGNNITVANGLTADGIVVNNAGGGAMNVAINNNTIDYSGTQRAILVQAGQDGNGANNVTITGNTVDIKLDGAGNAVTGFLVQNAITGPGNTSSLCADIGGAGALSNTFTHSLGGVIAGGDIRVRQRNDGTMRLPGYAGAATDLAAVVAYLNGRNVEVSSSTATADSTGFAGGAACTQPSLAPVTLVKTTSTFGQLDAKGTPVAPEAASAPQLSNAGQMDMPKASVAGIIDTTKLAIIGQMDTPKTTQGGSVDTPQTKLGESKLQPKHDGNKKSIAPKGITPNVANFPLTIGTLGAGKSVTITFSVTVNNPLPGGTTQVSNQGTVSGSNFASVLTDDPDVVGTNNPTVTGITAPPDINIKDATVGEPPSGTTSMLFAVTLSAPAPGPVSVNFATANGGATPATGGTCAGGADYETTNGTVNFIAGQQIQTIAIPVCSDATVEGDETFLVNLSTPTNGIIVDGQATGTITPNTPGVTLISELRTSGPGGTNDDFVEIYNNSDSPLMVAASDASAGYGLFKMGSACSDTPVLVGTIPNGTVMPARGHYLLVGSAYSLADYGGTGAAAGNVTMPSDIESDRNVALFNTSNILNISSTTRLDAVGFGANTGNNCDLLREGTNLGAVLGSTLQYSFVRKLETGRPQDTNNNVEDFVFVDTAATLVAGAGQRLGAPGPENLSNPLQRNATIKASLIDTGVASTVSPNRVRDTTPDIPNNSTFGTLDIRRKFTNNTGGSVTRLRFRIVDVTTFPQPPGTADLRARTSGNVTVTITGGTMITVLGTTVETPPAQPIGGGLNSTMSAGTVTLATPIAPGASIDLRFLLGVQQNGSFRFFVNVEALP